SRYLPPSTSPFLLVAAPPPTAIYTLSLHDALPICTTAVVFSVVSLVALRFTLPGRERSDAAESPSAPAASRHTGRAGTRVLLALDRKSTRLNSSHVSISYAVFCLKKKKHTENTTMF